MQGTFSGSKCAASWSEARTVKTLIFTLVIFVTFATTAQASWRVSEEDYANTCGSVACPFNFWDGVFKEDLTACPPYNNSANELINGCYHVTTCGLDPLGIPQMNLAFRGFARSDNGNYASTAPIIAAHTFSWDFCAFGGSIGVRRETNDSDWPIGGGPVPGGRTIAGGWDLVAATTSNVVGASVMGQVRSHDNGSGSIGVPLGYMTAGAPGNTCCWTAYLGQSFGTFHGCGGIGTYTEQTTPGEIDSRTQASPFNAKGYWGNVGGSYIDANGLAPFRSQMTPSVCQMNSNSGFGKEYWFTASLFRGPGFSMEVGCSTGVASATSAWVCPNIGADGLANLQDSQAEQLDVILRDTNPPVAGNLINSSPSCIAPNPSASQVASDFKICSHPLDDVGIQDWELVVDGVLVNRAGDNGSGAVNEGVTDAPGVTNLTAPSALCPMASSSLCLNSTASAAIITNNNAAAIMVTDAIAEVASDTTNVGQSIAGSNLIPTGAGQVDIEVQVEATNFSLGVHNGVIRFYDAGGNTDSISFRFNVVAPPRCNPSPTAPIANRCATSAGTPPTPPPPTSVTPPPPGATVSVNAEQIDSIFSYVFLDNPALQASTNVDDATAGCVQKGPFADPAGAAINFTSPSDTNRIVAVHINLQGLLNKESNSGNISGEHHMTREARLTNRQTADYLKAIGCSE